MKEKYPVLDYLKKMINEGASKTTDTHMQYPTAIAKTLGFKIVSVDKGKAVIQVDADRKDFGNQQGTVHGGFLAELADAAIGTAHSTLMKEGESFTSLELKINFFRPVWKNLLKAHASPIQKGKTISCYQCDVIREDGKICASVSSTVMTLRGDQAKGR